jgi:hypothetical protein
MRAKVYECKEKDEISNASVILPIILYTLFSVPEQQRLTPDIDPKRKTHVNYLIQVISQAEFTLLFLYCIVFLFWSHKI